MQPKPRAEHVLKNRRRAYRERKSKQKQRNQGTLEIGYIDSFVFVSMSEFGNSPLIATMFDYSLYYTNA